MPVPVDPFPDFVNNVDVADGDQVDARFKALYDALDPAQQGISDANMVDSAVTAIKLAALAVETAKLADGAVTTGKLADSAVTTAKIADATITAADVNGGLVQPLAGGALKIVKGAGVATYVAPDLLQIVINHGLGVAPIGVAVPAAGSNLFDNMVCIGVAAVDGTEIIFQFMGVNGLVAGNTDQCSCEWILLA